MIAGLQRRSGRGRRAWATSTAGAKAELVMTKLTPGAPNSSAIWSTGRNSVWVCAMDQKKAFGQYSSKATQMALMAHRLAALRANVRLTRKAVIPNGMAS